jgi:hypothetical protein
MSQLSIQNKILIYNQVIKPVCCGVVPARVTSISEVQRGIINAPWYARNSDILRDLGISMVTAEIKRLAEKH